MGLGQNLLLIVSLFLPLLDVIAWQDRVIRQVMIPSKTPCTFPTQKESLDFWVKPDVIYNSLPVQFPATYLTGFSR
ncbi:hypothetical protein F4780DRAFT_727564 [Xylariomycetidae sp. FL0641]|nr:hypothetical protein F4780DRAFT_727564 [Xylariomycetidae sp. FL0641]